MNTFVPVARLDEVPLGTVRQFSVDDTIIAVCHTSDGLFAFDNSCPHRGGPMAEGDLVENEIVCPWHLWAFDLRTGCTATNSAVKLRKHEVRVEAETVHVRLAAPEEQL